MGGGVSFRDRFAFSDGPKSFGWALSNLGVVPKVGGACVALEVDEIVPLCTPLCTPLDRRPIFCVYFKKLPNGRYFRHS